MLKQRIIVLERQNRMLRLELSKKDNAFMKCSDLCAFFSQILSNDYVTLQRTNGFKVPLGQVLMGPDAKHLQMNQFAWSNEDEEFFGIPPVPQSGSTSPPIDVQD